MCTVDSFKIDLNGLDNDLTVVKYRLGNDFFETVEASDVHEGELTTTLSIRKTSEFFQFDFHTEGIVHLTCDLCLDDMEQPIETDDRLIVKLGDTYREDDEMITVAEEEGILNVAWLIYEFIILAIPIKHVHAPGKCNATMEKLLQEHEAARSSQTDGEECVDPRWAKLKNLKI